jgi:hypothetical protein
MGCLFIHFDNLFLLIGVFMPFPFNIIISVLGL